MAPVVLPAPAKRPKTASPKKESRAWSSEGRVKVAQVDTWHEKKKYIAHVYDIIQYNSILYDHTMKKAEELSDGTLFGLFS